jgi:hypothetical protein
VEARLRSFAEQLVCAECKAEAPPDALGWRSYVVGIGDEVDRDEEVATYCPECAEREFGRRG